MSIKYSTNGNLALKVYSRQAGPQLKVIECAGFQEPSFRQIVDQVFADTAYELTAGSVASVLANMPGRAFCSTTQDKAFVAITGVVATFALFFFSFFAF